MRTHRRRQNSQNPPVEPAQQAEPQQREPLRRAPEKAPAQEPLIDSDLLAELANMDEGEFTSLMSQAIGDQPSTRRLEPGDKVSGVVVRRTNNDVFVHVGAKQEATLDAAECDAQVGDRIEAFVLTANSAGVRLGLRLRGQQAREHLESAMEAGLPIEGRVQERNGGGFVVDLAGVRAFCPVSHIALRPSTDLDSYIGRTLDFRVLEISRREAVVSHRVIEEEQARQEQLAFWEKAREGDVVDGRVASIQAFGVFVDLGPVQGLVPRSKLEGQEPQVDEAIKVRLIRVSRSEGKVTLEPAGPKRGARRAHEEQGSLGTFAELFKGKIG